MRPITVTVGPGTPPLTSPPIRLDEWADPPLGVQVAVNGTANYTMQHSFDEGPDSLVNPLPLGSMMWDTSLLPSAGTGTANTTFSVPVAPLWMRITLNSGTGSVRMVLTQYNVVEK